MNVPTATTVEAPLVTGRWSLGGSALRGTAKFCRAKPLGAFGLVILLVFVIAAALAPLLSPYNPIANNSLVTLAKPSLSHLFGTDQYGRDLFSRVLYGARTSLSISVAAGLLSAAAATVFGIISAFYGSAIDYTLQRVVDTILSVPGIVLLIAVMATFGVTIPNMIWA